MGLFSWSYHGVCLKRAPERKRRRRRRRRRRKRRRRTRRRRKIPAEETPV